MSINTNRVLVGESLKTLKDGTKELTMRNGMVYTFSPEEWDEYNTDFMECSTQPSDHVDLIIQQIVGRNIVPASEMIDALLDLRNKCVEVEDGLSSAVSMLLSNLKENHNES